MNSRTISAFVLVLVVGLAAGYGAGSMTHFEGQFMPGAARVVNLDVIPDWGGFGYSAFVIPSHVNETTPRHATSSSPPGPNDNNITVPMGVSVTFVITNLDPTVSEIFAGPASTDFTIYNDTEGGYVALHYIQGQSMNTPIGHTFTITSLNINIPLPPDTIVTFTHTFITPGVFEYVCLVSGCGAGMNLLGYMDGYLTVTSS